MNDTELAAMNEELLALYAETFAVTARAFEKLADFHRKECAQWMSYQSTAHYLNVAAGISIVTAREHVRIACALEALPLVKAAFARGSISYSKVRAISRMATPENQEALLNVANHSTAAQLDRLVRGCQGVTAEAAKKQSLMRSAEYGFDADGMFYLRARLLPDEGARLMHALDAHASAEASLEWSQRRADAVMALLTQPAGEVIVHIDGEGACQVETPRGEHVACSAETARRVACDASVVAMAHDKDGNVLNVGRKSRKIPTALRRALADRDRGCRYPGCPNQIVDAHHIEHWADGGETKLSNLIQLCRFHHTQLHEGSYSIRDGHFVNADGVHLSSCGVLPAPATSNVQATRWEGVDWTWRSMDYSYVSSMLLAK